MSEFQEGVAPATKENGKPKEEIPVEKTRAELQREVQELREEVKRLEKMALYDSLAESVYGKAAFSALSKKEHAHAVREGEPYAVFVLDLDNFKPVNDTLGHAAGDKIIAAVGRACVGSLRETDIVGRIGGDEFAGILVGFRAEQTQMIRDKISGKLKEEMTSAREEIRDFLSETGEISNIEERLKAVDSLGFSMGVAEFKGEQNFEEVLHKADTDMYVKKKGKKENG